MSGISGLFANSKKDSKLENLFASKDDGPVKRQITKRTIIPTKTQNESKDESEDESMEDASDSDKSEEEQKRQKPKQNKRKNREEDDDLEGRYLEKILDHGKEEEKVEEPKSQDPSEPDSDSEDEEEDKPKQSKEGSKAKALDLKAEEIEKAERTVFVGNLSSQVITSKSDYKEFKKFFLKHGAIASIRFRSIAFNEALPRKVAFVQQKLHSSRDSVNAYVVFKEKEPAREALKSNGSVFLNLHLRVDSVSHPAKIDNNRAIFVGNLDFEEKEEELWNIFAGCGEIEFVRIVRDAKTNVGKGFGYVQFKDFTSVSKALLMHEKKLGEKKRKLRITRSKKMKPRTQEDNHNNTRRGQQVRHLTDDQKTKLGRAKRVLGKADRATAGQQVIEGIRAKKGDGAAGIKNGKNRVKKPRIRQRSTDFKKVRDSLNKK